MARADTSLAPDQSAVFGRLAEALRAAGVDPDGGAAEARGTGRPAQALAVLGRAGSGKTLLLAHLQLRLIEAGVDVAAAEHEGRRRAGRRTVAVLAPTNKAASVLRRRGVPATTIHRVLYTPVYAPEYQALADWLAGEGPRPTSETLGAELLERARAAHERLGSIPAALAAAGLRGTDFITGWTRRKSALDIGLVDEASMLDARLLEDLRAIFPTLILFGDPAQLPPVGEGGGMVFDRLPAEDRLELTHVHRQAGDNPILDLAHALADPALDFEAFEALLRQSAGRDPRLSVATRAETDAMARAPVLCWRNATRIRLIDAFRRAHGAPAAALVPGEPLICDGIELPLKQRQKRYELEARGLIRGAPAIYLGPGKQPGFARIHLPGAEAPRFGVAAIIRIERPAEEEPLIVSAARMGAVFVHGAAVTIHKAQGSQWPEVQVFAPDLWAAARSGRVEAGVPLWKRLAYVAITRAEERLVWVVRNRLSRPARPLGTNDLPKAPPSPLALAGG